MDTTYPTTHFASVGKRVRSEWDDSRVGTVIEDLGDGSVAVRWDNEPEPTVCYPFDIEPA